MARISFRQFTDYAAGTHVVRLGRSTGNLSFQAFWKANSNQLSAWALQCSTVPEENDLVTRNDYDLDATADDLWTAVSGVTITGPADANAGNEIHHVQGAGELNLRVKFTVAAAQTVTLAFAVTADPGERR